MENYEKKYKEVLEKAKALYKASEPMSGCNVILETLFPEIKESEDKQSKKWILEYLYDGLRKSDEQFKGQFKAAIAWLEKQEGCEYIKKDWLEHIKQSWYKEGFIDGKYSGGTSKEWTINDAATLKELIDFLENGTAKLQHDLTRYANWLKNQFTPIEKQGENCLVNFDEAEKEKYDFVSGQFIECRKSFNGFKEDNSYWLEYVGDDNYIGRSDNILNQKFHITPRQLFTLFTWQHRPKENNVNEETNAPTGYGKYVDECLNEASKHFFSEGEDKYSVADLFYAGVRCGKSWFEKQAEQELQLKEGKYYECIKSYYYLGGGQYWFDKGKVYFCEKDGYLRSDPNNLIYVYDCENWQSYFRPYIGKSVWSEEDEIGLDDTLWAIKQARTIAKDENDMGNLWYAENWLKSIKQRYT